VNPTEADRGEEGHRGMKYGMRNLRTSSGSTCSKNGEISDGKVRNVPANGEGRKKAQQGDIHPCIAGGSLGHDE